MAAENMRDDDGFHHRKSNALLISSPKHLFLNNYNYAYIDIRRAGLKRLYPPAWQENHAWLVGWEWSFLETHN